MTTRSAPLVRYERHGGRPPADDESLAIAADGSFTARRTIGGARIGRFAGDLPARATKAIVAAVHAVGAADDLTVATPRDGATEVVSAVTKTGRFGSNEQPSAPWGPLLDRLREALDTTVTEAPVAALELVATSRDASLRHVGEEPLDVDVDSIEVRLVRLSADGAVLGRWNGRLGAEPIEDAPTPTPVFTTAAADWVQALPFDHPLELAPGDWLQVWVTVRVRDDGERAGRLFAAVQATAD